MKFALTFAAVAALWTWSPAVTVIVADLALYLLAAMLAGAFCSIGNDVDRDEEAGDAVHRSAF